MSTKKAQQSELTQHHLVQVARRLFAARGYAGVGTEEIVADAGVTRGALYHQYKDKKDLFAAVVDDVMRDIHEGLRSAAAGQTDLLLSLDLGVEAFLEISQRPDVLTIAFRDGPSVLGWAKWRELDSQYGLGLLEGLLQRGMETGQIVRQPPKTLAHLVLGALTEAAFLIGNSVDPATTQTAVLGSLNLLLAGLKSKPV